jgi:cytochrome c biogenesis factor
MALTSNHARRSISAYIMALAVIPGIIGTVYAMSVLLRHLRTQSDDNANVAGFQRRRVSGTAESALLVVNCVVLVSLLVLLCSGNAFRPWT